MDLFVFFKKFFCRGCARPLAGVTSVLVNSKCQTPARRSCGGLCFGAFRQTYLPTRRRRRPHASKPAHTRPPIAGSGTALSAPGLRALAPSGLPTPRFRLESIVV